MSEVPPIPTEFCPQRKSLTNRHLFDHLRCAHENRSGYGKTECLGSLEVQDHLKFGRELNGQLLRLRPAQNAIDITGHATNDVYLVASVGEQAAISGKD